MHLDAVARARAAAGVVENRPVRVLVAMNSGGDEVVRRLRAEGIAAAEVAADDAMRYARMHGYTHVVKDAEMGHVRMEEVRGPGTGEVVRVDGIWESVWRWVKGSL